MGHGTSTARTPAVTVVEVLLTDNQRVPSDHILDIHDTELLKFAATVTLFAMNVVAASRFPLLCTWH